MRRLDLATPPRLISLAARSALLGALVLAAIAPAAGAHVTAQPPELPAGEFVKVTFRAPTERDVPTTKLAVQFPPELDAVRVQPVTGWSYKITRKRLPQPREVFGEQVTEYISEIEWTRGEIGVDEFQEFPVSMRLPERGTFGEYISFPALQTYENGEVVRWIQRPETPTGNWDELEEPAAHLQLTSATPASEEPAFATQDDVDDEVGGPRTLAIIGLVLAVLALLAAGAALRRRARVTA
jgi:uncharacterized protein YcnI